MHFLRRYKKYAFIPVDIICIASAYLLTLLLRFDTGISGSLINLTETTVIAGSILTISGLLIFHGYNNLWKYGSVKDYIKTLLVCAGSLIVFLVVVLCFRDFFLPWKVVLFSHFIGTILIISTRVFFRLILSATDLPSKHEMGARTLIIGSGSAAKILIDDIYRYKTMLYHIVGMIDDNPEKIGRNISGIKIFGNRQQIVSVCKDQQIAVIIIAIPSMNQTDLQKLITLCSKTGCKVKLMSAISSVISDYDS